MPRNYKKVTVDCEQLRIAVEKYVDRYNLSYNEIAVAADMGEQGKRLRETLGIIKNKNGGFQHCVRPATAARIIRAIDRAPHEFGI